MKIIIGLGNIGKKYLKTRHNCGFLVLDELVKQLEEEGISIEWKEETKFDAFIAKIIYHGKNILLAKPTTFMNNSGKAAQKIINFFKEPLNNLLLIYDDIDLPLGEIRIREKGSAGTHNGIKSVIQELASEDFKRIRIGIESRGELTEKQQTTTNFVLANFTKKEYPAIEKAIKEAVQELKNLILS